MYKESNITSVETETYIEENVSNRMSHMGISMEIKMSLLAKMVKVRF